MSSKKYVKTLTVYEPTAEKRKGTDRYYATIKADKLEYFVQGKKKSLDNRQSLKFLTIKEYVAQLQYKLDNGTLQQSAFDKLSNVPDFVKGKILTFDFEELYNVVETRDGRTTVKVTAERLIAHKDDFEVEYNRGDYQDFLDVESNKRSLEYRLQNGYIDEEKYQSILEMIEKTPAYVAFDIGGKGQILS